MSRGALTVVLATLLTACMGPPAKVETVEDSLALLAIGIRSVAQEAKHQYIARRISTEQRDTIAEALQNAQDAAQAATASLAAGDTTTALGRLAVARQALQSVEAILREHRTSIEDPPGVGHLARAPDLGGPHLVGVRGAQVAG